MKKEIKEFLELIANGRLEDIDERTRAKKLLEDDLKEETLDKFDYLLNDSWNREELKNAILKKDFVKIIYFAENDSSVKKFINENFVNFHEIVDILYNACRPKRKNEEDVLKEVNVNE